MHWYLEVLKKYAQFDGRSRRKEYWMFVLFNFIIALVLGIIDGVLGLRIGEGGNGILSTIYSLAVFIPSLAVTVRRLHDTNRTGWWILIGLIPIIGFIVLLICYLQEGDAAENQYGPPPTEGTAAPAATG